MRHIPLAAVTLTAAFTLGCLSSGPPEDYQPPEPPVVEATPGPASVGLPAPAAAATRWADGAKLGPVDPDPDLVGDEIGEGQWAFQGIIYDKDGTIYGCEGGGNWCSGPPPGAAEAAFPGMPVGFPETLGAVTLVDGSWRRLSGCLADATVVFSQNDDGKLQIAFMDGGVDVAVVETFAETADGYALTLKDASGATSTLPIQRKGTSPAWSIAHGGKTRDYGEPVWTVGLGTWKEAGCGTP